MPKVVKDNINALIMIELARQERSKKWLASKLGMRSSSLYNRMDRNTVDADLAIKIAKILGVDYRIFLKESYTQRVTH